MLHSFDSPPGYCLWLQWREEIGKPEGGKTLVSPGEVGLSAGHLGEWLVCLRASLGLFCVRDWRLWDSLPVHACMSPSVLVPPAPPCEWSLPTSRGTSLTESGNQSLQSTAWASPQSFLLGHLSSSAPRDHSASHIAGGASDLTSFLVALTTTTSRIALLIRLFLVRGLSPPSGYMFSEGGGLMNLTACCIILSTL